MRSVDWRERPIYEVVEVQNAPSNQEVGTEGAKNSTSTQEYPQIVVSWRSRRGRGRHSFSSRDKSSWGSRGGYSRMANKSI